MNTASLLLSQVGKRPDAPALIETTNNRDRVLTFAQLDRRSAQAATLLRASGLRAGQSALVLQPMGIELYVALVALFRLGVVAVFLDPSAGREHIARCCALYPPDAFIGSAKAHWLRWVSASIRRIPRRFVIGNRLPVWGATSWQQERLDCWTEVTPCDADTPALLTFTSGSTGEPKAAVRTHGLLRAQHRALEDSIALEAGEIDLTTLPIFALANLGSGVTSLLAAGDLRHPGKIKPAPVAAQIRRWAPTRSAASPAFFERLLAGRVALDAFRKIYTGGAPVFPILMDRLQTAALGADVVAVYGSTEAEPIAHSARREMADVELAAMAAGRGLLTGPPVPCVSLRVLPDQWEKSIGPFSQDAFEALCLGPNEAGEIVVSGAHVLPGYLHGQGDEETKFRVDDVPWHRTGDSGYLDGQNRLWLLGRCGARIVDARGVLYPFAVECAARQHPGVRRAALVAHQGRRLLILEAEHGAFAPDVARLHEELGWAHLERVMHFDDRLAVWAARSILVTFPMTSGASSLRT